MNPWFLFLQPFATLIAAFAGAWFAFRLNDRAKERRTLREQVAAVNQALFILMRQFDSLKAIQNQIIDPTRNHPARFIAMKASLPIMANSPKLDLNTLGFLVETGHPQLLRELLIEQERFGTALQALNERSRLHLEELQPAMASAGIMERTGYPAERIVEVLGQPLFLLMRRVTDQAIELVDNAIGSNLSFSERFRNAMKAQFPGQRFIKLELKEPTDNPIEADTPLEKTMTDTTRLAQQCEDVLESILGLALQFLRSLRFDRKNPQQLISVCLYARLRELASASKSLMEKQDTLVGILVLLRSMFEASIDLTNLMKCPDYWKRMYASFLEQKLRVMKDAASPTPSPLIVALTKHRDTQKDLEEAQEEYNSYVSKGNGPIDIRCRAERAGKPDEYLTIYRELCLHSHSNIRSLETWYIETEESGDYHVVAFKSTKEDLIEYVAFVSHILFDQTKSLAEFLGMKEIDFAPYSREMEQLAEALKKKAEEEEANKPDTDTGKQRA